MKGYPAMKATFPSSFVRVLLSMSVVVSMLVGCASDGARSVLTIVDGDTGLRMPARVHMRDPAGTEFVPDGAQTVPIGKSDRWFVSDGLVPLRGLAGCFEIRVEHGTEYKPIKRTIEIREGRTRDHELKLVRWIDMRARGYTCGENHLHVPADELGAQLAAEGLDFGTSLQWWNGPKYEVPAGEGFVRDLQFAGVTVPSSVCDCEIEHAWGAAYVVGMPEPLGAETDKRCPNLPIIRQAHEAGALVCYQGGWSREVLPDALLGCVDVVNVCNNNFHRHQFQPRPQYSNLLNVEGFPEYPPTPVGMMRMNTDTYYRLLNCGLRLAAGAGSATGAKKTPVGYNRAYVRAGKNPSLPEFLEAWRAGRNFVTCGPMLFLTVNETYEPGDTIELGPQGSDLTIEVEAVSDQPLTSLEVVVNGKVIGEMPTLPGTKARFTLTAPIAEGSWIAARCTDDDQLLTIDELNANHHYGSKDMPRRPCRLRFAHTSPVYVTVDGQGPRVPESIHQARCMLDAFEAFTKENATGQCLEEMLEALKTARQRLGN